MFKKLIFIFIIFFGEKLCESNAMASDSVNGKTTDQVVISPNETNQIRVAVYTHLIKEIVRPKTNALLFIAANKDELALIKTNFPNIIIEPAENREIVGHKVRDKVTKKSGIIVAVQWINITKTSEADVHAGYFSGAGVTYDFQMYKEESVWQIRQVSGPSVFDAF